MIEGRVTWKRTFFHCTFWLQGYLEIKKNFYERGNSFAFTKYGHLSKPGGQNSYLNRAELRRIKISILSIIFGFSVIPDSYKGLSMCLKVFCT